MNEEDLAGASTADLMRALALRFEESNGIEFVDTMTLAYVKGCAADELRDRGHAN